MTRETTNLHEAIGTLPVSPSNLPRLLWTYLAARVWPFIWGAPGIGKSDIVRQLAGALNLPVLDIRASLLDPVDLRGLPSVQDGSTRWNVPTFLPDPERDGERGIVFLDELNAAAPAVQVALYQWILDGRIGDWQHPEGWLIVAAGNRPQDRAGAQRMSTALANRLGHVSVEPDADAYTAWAAGGGEDLSLPALPADPGRRSSRPDGVAFVRYRPETLCKVPDGGQAAWPSPRSHARADVVMDVIDAHPDMEDLRTHAVAGLIGHAAATERLGFMDLIATLPDLDTVFQDPEGAPLPEGPGQSYAIASALGRKADADTFGAAITYMQRLDTPEFGVVMIQDSLRRDADLAQCPEFVRWAVDNQDVTLGVGSIGR